VPVERVKEFQGGLTEFLTTQHANLLAKIAAEKELSDALTAGLKAAVEGFRKTVDFSEKASVAGASS